MTKNISFLPSMPVNRLVIVKEGNPYVWRGKIDRRRWVCDCSCGRETQIREDHLSYGTTRSCGCLRSDRARELSYRHGGRANGRKTPEYNVWQDLLHRKDAVICVRWRLQDGAGFANFLEDMGRKPGERYRLIRLNPRYAYSKKNCRWEENPRRQGVLRKLIDWRGNKLTLKQAAAIAGIKPDTLSKRLARGWSIADAMERKVD